MSAFALKLLLQLGMAMQPPVLPPEPDPQPPPTEPPPSDPTPPTLPAELEPVEFPLAPDSDPRGDEPLPRMEPAPSSQPRTTQRSIVDLRDPFNRPPVRPRSGEHAFAQQRLLMPDLKDPFAEGTRPVRSRTLDLRVPSDLRDPFRDGLGRKRAAGPGACVRTTSDGTVVQAPGRPREEACSSGPSDLHDPFRGDPATPRQN